MNSFGSWIYMVNRGNSRRERSSRETIRSTTNTYGRSRIAGNMAAFKRTDSIIRKA